MTADIFDVGRQRRMTYTERRACAFDGCPTCARNLTAEDRAALAARLAARLAHPAGADR